MAEPTVADVKIVNTGAQKAVRCHINEVVE